MYSERSNGSGTSGGAGASSTKVRASRSGRGPRGRSDARKADGSPLILYVEGPGDCDILRCWARRVSRDLERAICDGAVILGGRQPARGVEHFRRMRESANEARGLCVLDRDDEAESTELNEPGLEFFTWPQRHIESYLLVPSAIARYARRERDTPYVEQLLTRLRGDDEVRRGPGGIDAKRLLSPKGPLARELGCALSPAAVARSMRRDELHEDVGDLFDRVSELAGLRRDRDPVVVRRSRGSKPRTGPSGR